jgi:unspecific monooxygenase
MQRLSQSPRDPDFVQDPYPFYERARAAGPLFLWEDYGFPCAAGHDAVNALLRDRRLGREPPGGPPPRADHLRDFYAMDDLGMLDREPPAHTRLRGLVLRAFTARRVAALEPEIAALALGLIDDIDGPEFDLLPAFAERLPVIVIARLLGVPDAMADQLLGWSHAMVAMYQARRDRGVEDAANAAARAFAGYLRGLVAERRARPADDLISALAAAEAAGDRLSQGELIATCVLLLNAGHEATVHVIGNGVRALLAAGADPARAFRDAAATAAAVEEMLRFDPPSQYQGRTLTRDVELHGRVIPKDAKLMIVNGASGRDERRFRDPDRLDVRREIEFHLGFGYGRHICLGAFLARMESRVALEEFFRRWPEYGVPEDGVERMHSSNVRGLAGLVLEAR